MVFGPSAKLCSGERNVREDAVSAVRTEAPVHYSKPKREPASVCSNPQARVRGPYYEYNVRGYAVIPGVDIRVMPLAIRTSNKAKFTEITCGGPSSRVISRLAPLRVLNHDAKGPAVSKLASNVAQHFLVRCRHVPIQRSLGGASFFFSWRQHKSACCASAETQKSGSAQQQL